MKRKLSNEQHNELTNTMCNSSGNSNANTALRACTSCFLCQYQHWKLFHIHRQIHRDVAVFRNLQMKLHTEHRQYGSVACVYHVSHLMLIGTNAPSLCVSGHQSTPASLFLFLFSLVRIVWSHSFQSYDSNSIWTEFDSLHSHKIQSSEKGRACKTHRKRVEKNGWMDVNGAWGVGQCE